MYKIVAFLALLSPYAQASTSDWLSCKVHTNTFCYGGKNCKTHGRTKQHGNVEIQVNMKSLEVRTCDPTTNDCETSKSRKITIIAENENVAIFTDIFPVEPNGFYGYFRLLKGSNTLEHVLSNGTKLEAAAAYLDYAKCK
jgi:hypothetical protein